MKNDKFQHLKLSSKVWSFINNKLVKATVDQLASDYGVDKPELKKRNGKWQIIEKHGVTTFKTFAEAKKNYAERIIYELEIIDDFELFETKKEALQWIKENPEYGYESH